MSEKNGYNHLYLYTSGGNLVKQITKGNFEVKDFLGWDEATNTFYFESNEGSPLRTAIYKVDGKGKKTKLSKQEGTHKAIFSNNMKYYINTYSNINTPPVITLNDNNGKELATLVDNNTLKHQVSRLNMPSKELFSFKTNDGVELNGWIMKPANFNPNKNILLSCTNIVDRVHKKLQTNGELEPVEMAACSKLIWPVKASSWLV